MAVTSNPIYKINRVHGLALSNFPGRSDGDDGDESDEEHRGDAHQELLHLRPPAPGEHLLGVDAASAAAPAPAPGRGLDGDEVGLGLARLRRPLDGDGRHLDPVGIPVRHWKESTSNFPFQVHEKNCFRFSTTAMFRKSKGV